MKKVVLPLTTILIIVFLEMFSRSGLFARVSYFSYESIDWQMQDLSDTPAAEILFLGSSEVRYGFDPQAFESAIGAKDGGVKTFNLGIDGMNLSFYNILLPYLYPRFETKSVRYALIGVNLTEDVVDFPRDDAGKINCKAALGDLQRGVFTSPFGIDSGLSDVCKPDRPKWKIQKWAEDSFASYRYRKYLRAWLLTPYQKKRSREELNITKQGFHVRPHAESKADLDTEFDKWWEDEGKAAKQVDGELFAKALSDKGVYSQMSSFLIRHDITPVFVSLPTNPRMVEMLDRRGIYKERSKQFSEWAKKNEVVFVDLGLKDNYNPVSDFADRRHLSALGAKKFSTELGTVMKDYLVRVK